MPSQTGIVNRALRWIGGTRITSLADGTKNGNVATDIYDDTLADMLRAHKWNFATKRVQLARSATTPAFDFSYGYVLPSDWIRTLQVFDNDGGFGAVDFREETLGGQRVLLASTESLYLRYIASITDPNLWSADFVTAFTAALAAGMAIPVADSNTILDAMEKKAAKWLRKARSSDALGNPPEARPVGSWAASRNGGWRDSSSADWPR